MPKLMFLLAVLGTLSAAVAVEAELQSAKLQVLQDQLNAAKIELEELKNPNSDKAKIQATKAELKEIRNEIKAAKARAKAGD